ncbi:peptidase S10 [Betaproteobacteria bacterium GR16-43]|nr:peptidase S10 [Betaproteobacteria bacterium GR16-43]
MATDTEKPLDKKPDPTDQISITKHRVKIAGREVKYTVTCGTMVMREEAEKEGKSEGEKARATVFFIAYTLDGVKDNAKRPVTFSFNGGPGSSSVWLHLGLLGPKRVALDDEGYAPEPPYHLVDNEYSVLPQTDLVFIDPVGTGFSRMVEGEKVKEYHDYKRDLESVGQFIRTYCSRYARWSSAKYLIGESYGTTRASGLAGHLIERYGMFLNGVMLVSVALDFQTFRFDATNDVPPILFLPTYASTAWYHKRLAPDLQKMKLRALLDEVEAFAGGEYAAALFQGDALPDADRKKIARKLARYTGLSAEYVERCNLRIEILRFCKELLRNERRTVGRLDSRYTGMDRDAAGEKFEFDPGFSAIYGAYAATMNDYLRTDLKFEKDLPYEILKSLYMDWGWGEFANRFASVGETLRKAMCMNPHMRVLVANGYYDFATPHFASDYTMDHLGLEPELRKNIEVSYYEAGHMMYVHRPSIAALSKRLRAFIKG